MKNEIIKKKMSVVPVDRTVEVKFLRHKKKMSVTIHENEM